MDYWSGSFGIVHRAIWNGTVVAAKVMRITSIDQREIEAYK